MMAFRRGADEDGSRDDHLPFLTRPQARRVRMLVRQEMAERGREVAVSGGHAQDDHGTIFSLRNIAAICHNDPRGEKAWPQLVAGYVDKVLAISPEGTARELAGLTAGQVRDHVFAVVVHAASLGPGIASFPSAPEFAPGLLELLAFDRPDSWVYLPDDDVARLGGRTWLLEAGLANLRALPAPGYQHLDRAGGNLGVIYDESPYTASRLLTLPDLLTRVLGSADAPYGVLAAMPCRHRAHLHILRDSTAWPSLRLMASYTRLVHSEEPGRISPDLLWWRDGTWTVLSPDIRDGKATLRINGELADIFRELTTRPPGTESTTG
jgi:hypothetical protein